MRNRCAAIGLALALATAAQAQAQKPAQPPSPLSPAHTADTPEPDESAQESAWDAYLHRVAAQLAGSGSGRDLAFAAILINLSVPPFLQEDADSRAPQWRQAALERAGRTCWPTNCWLPGRLNVKASCGRRLRAAGWRWNPAISLR